MIIKILIVSAAILTLFAWWLSAQHNKRTRALTAYLKTNHAAFWQSLPWHARNLNPAAAIEAYRRSGNANDPTFLALYAARQRSSRTLIYALGMAMLPIAILLLGVTFLGWTW